MNKVTVWAILVPVLILLTIGVYVYGAYYSTSDFVNEGVSGSKECEQSSTSSGCMAMFSESQVKPTYESLVWKQHIDKELGISFSYPTNENLENYNEEDTWISISGETGRTISGYIYLPSGANVRFKADTKDFSISKGGVAVSTQGFVLRDGKYYEIRRGEVEDVPFVPDEVWELSNGSSAAVNYGKNFDPHADYYDPAVRATLNIPSSKFAGVGFMLSGPEVPGPASDQDAELFKQIITSIRFLK